jgi:hypothetical protein
MKHGRLSGKFVTSQLVVPIKTTTALASAVLTAFVLLQAIQKVFTLRLNGIALAVLDFYRDTVRVPVVWVLSRTRLRGAPWMADLIFVYTLFGIATTRSLMSVYWMSDEYVVKGVWGTISANRLMLWLYRRSKYGRAVYQALAVLLWPIVAAEYLFRYKYVWKRYLDSSGVPNFNAIIGTFTMSQSTMPTLFYNQTLGYDLATDSWFRLEGDFRLIFVGNLLLAAAILAVLLALGTLGLS